MRPRGVTILEVVIALAILVVAATGLFATLSAATAASLESARQAQARAQAMTLLEAAQRAPAATLDCLSVTPAEAWSRCGEPFTVGREGAASPIADSFVRKRSDHFYDLQITVAEANARSVTLASGVFR